MNKVILCSEEDPASLNIRERLIESFGFREDSSTMFGNPIYRRGDIRIITVNRPSIYADEEVSGIDAGLIVVASKHVSEAGVKAVLSHPVGNWGEKAEFGGRPRALAVTSARAVFAAVSRLRSLLEDAGLTGWDVGMEATHHGPYSEKPLLFVELGSSPAEWSDPKMGEIVAEACLAACAAERVNVPEIAVGFGGGHYTPRFTPLVLQEKVAFGHVAPKYHFPLSSEMIREAFEKTVERPKLAYIDWKGINSEQRQRLLEELSGIGVEYVRL
ncbi:MAG: D-tyrosyl-tRNA(Tyr) deacylase [Aigarchaeota archaeon]|nr:D-tyrosyl-tRNA(Tyr) deacylase [Candidatus Pelearchaeum maunauluense]